jgi:peptidoglycan/xylan/chitin deacetylase (PgdA/CDA1 family)
MKTKIILITFTLIILILCFITIFPFLFQLQPLSYVVSISPINGKVIALTFDDGAYNNWTTSVLNTLDENNIKCTFFLLGNFIESYPGLIRKMSESGHEICNHSYSHPYLSKLSANEVKNEIVKTEKIIFSTTGKPPIKLFIPPYGDYNEKIQKILFRLNYKYIITWLIDTDDWEETSADSIVNKVINESQSGGIIIMHLGDNPQTAQALPRIIKFLKQSGYRFAKISELLPSSDKIVYSIKPQEFLWQICEKFEISMSSLIQNNPSTDFTTLVPGQVLSIPMNENKYIVKKGDTLILVAAKFNTTVNSIVKLNNLKIPFYIYPGQTLKIK